MNEVEFRNWLEKKQVNKKVRGDLVSRLKRIEHELNHCDIDEHYKKDGCEHLLSVFKNKGENDVIRGYPNANLPISKYYMSTYSYSIRQYIRFCEETMKDKR